MICFPSEKGEKYWVRKRDGELETGGGKKITSVASPWVKRSLSTVGFTWFGPVCSSQTHLQKVRGLPGRTFHVAPHHGHQALRRVVDRLQGSGQQVKRDRARSPGNAAGNVCWKRKPGENRLHSSDRTGINDPKESRFQIKRESLKIRVKRI